MNEATLQALVRLEAAKQGWMTWRNNTGVLLDREGRPVRYGLCNDSSAVNRSVKSGDLIGIRPVRVTQEMVDQVIGQFVSLEVKHTGWHQRNDEHTQAQQRWIDIVTRAGGYAKFVTKEGDLK